MFKYPKNVRLCKADEFSSVFIFRKCAHGSFFKIHYKPNEGPHARLGIVVGRKTHKRAVWRNYMKRMVRETFRKNMHTWSNLDIIVRIIKPFNIDNVVLAKAEFELLTKRFVLN